MRETDDRKRCQNFVDEFNGIAIEQFGLKTNVVRQGLDIFEIRTNEPLIAFKATIRSGEDEVVVALLNAPIFNLTAMRDDEIVSSVMWFFNMTKEETLWRLGRAKIIDIPYGE